MTEPLTLVPGKPDAELAEEFKRRIEEIYKPVCEMFDEAVAAGFVLQIQIAPNAFGRHVISTLMVAKKF